MNVPKLRFKEFKSEWKLHTLKNKLDFLAGYAFSSKLMCSYTTKYQLIKMTNIYQNELSLHRNPSYWDSLDSSTEKYLLKRGDTLLTLTGTVGKKDYGYSVDINEDNRFLLNQRLVRVREIQNKSTNRFIRYLVTTEKFLNQFFTCSKGGTGNQSNVSVEDIKLIRLFFPSLPEQTKIANFLTAIDERITQLTQKHDLLKQYKKGVMQQIFSQKLRFKDDDGREFPEWEEKFGCEVFKSISDKNHNSDLPILAISQEHGAVPREMIDYNISVTDRSIETYKVVQVGDFIISLRSFQGGIEYSAYKGICSPAYIILRPSIEINRTFFRFYMKTERYIKELNRKLEGIRDGKMISYKYFSEILLPFPSLSEQTKVANFLTAIDDKITQTQTQLEAVKQYKKGLLQQMFV